MWVQAYARTALLLLGHQGSGDHWLAGENPRNVWFFIVQSCF